MGLEEGKHQARKWVLLQGNGVGKFGGENEFEDIEGVNYGSKQNIFLLGLGGVEKGTRGSLWKGTKRR